MFKKILMVLGVIILLPIILFQVGRFLPIGVSGMLFDKLTNLFEKTQTVGSVTANRSAGALKITEITSSTWKYPQTVIGQAYQIERTNNDSKPVRVEFAYDPDKLDPKIPETVLRLYKWHGEAKNPYWAPIKSSVDTTRHVVTAELTSFSVLAVHAPLMYYWPESDVTALNTYLASLIKKIPEYSCGINIVVGEELIEWVDGEIVEHYLRPDGEDVETRDCRRREGSVIPTISNWQSHEREMKWGPKQSRNTQYTIDVSIIWQTDDQKSAEVDGIVRDQKGKPLEGITVTAKKIVYWPTQEKAVTKEDGSYHLDLHSGEYKVTADPTVGGNGKHKNCIAGGYTEKLFAFGEFNKDPEGYVHVPWQKDITLQCSDYYIDETVTLPIDATTYGIRTQGTETQHITGRLVQPTPGGYGWEGIWEVDQVMETKTRQSGTMVIMGGTIQMPPASHTARDHFNYQFTLLRGMRVGSTFAIVGSRAGDGYQLNTTLEGGAVKVVANGGEASWNIGGGTGNTSAGYVSVAQTHKIISVNDEDGLVLELPAMLSSQLPKVSVKKIAK
ncbi:MAG: hypothetical protein A2261_03470 [Candidatus Magasanikbacteria bacterium RIFOXYA2_FULL_44_8]|uniref:Carboxypeptidase regulatory-like domain-containing protein n=1 Tax=Candidatus Magasanikbacteria bacterium RIFOXYA2_FULL_44_8 TaxID=1798696 RepID=A0A1F6NJE8_9BACT|nr:MAG: hypothetical protein A2261_03470 [Candidatus Magasanikbacteria bacterium RIFOXYA2_FULL_44_8]